MKKLKTSVALAALAAIILASPAVAADVDAPMPEAVNWTAFSVGVGGGATYGLADDETGIGYDAFDLGNDIHSHAGGGSFSDLGKAGGFGTIQAGFDYQMDSVVIGLLANYDFGKTKMSNTFLGIEDDLSNINNHTDIVTGTATGESKWEIGDSWGIGGRLGFLASDSALLYVLGGYTEAKIKSESSLRSDNNNFAVSFSDDAWEDGWFIGGGVETLLTNNISLKAEYRYADFGKIDRSDEFDFNDGIISGGTSQSADITVHSVRAVLSYRFNLF